MRQTFSSEDQAMIRARYWDLGDEVAELLSAPHSRASVAVWASKHHLRVDPEVTRRRRGEAWRGKKEGVLRSADRSSAVTREQNRPEDTGDAHRSPPAPASELAQAHAALAELTIAMRRFEAMGFALIHAMQRIG